MTTLEDLQRIGLIRITQNFNVTNNNVLSDVGSGGPRHVLYGFAATLLVMAAAFVVVKLVSCAKEKVATRRRRRSNTNLPSAAEGAEGFSLSPIVLSQPEIESIELSHVDYSPTQQQQQQHEEELQQQHQQDHLQESEPHQQCQRISREAAAFLLRSPYEFSSRRTRHGKVILVSSTSTHAPRANSSSPRRKRLRGSRLRAECSICFRSLGAEKPVALVPCGHASFCAECAKRIAQNTEKKKKKATCPVCRTKIEKTVQIYLS